MNGNGGGGGAVCGWGRKMDGVVHLLIRDATHQKDDVNRNACDPGISYKTTRPTTVEKTMSYFVFVFQGHACFELRSKTEYNSKVEREREREREKGF